MPGRRWFKKGDRVAAYGYRNGKLTRFGKGVVLRRAPAKLGNTSQYLDDYIKIRLDDGFTAYFPEAKCKHLKPKPQPVQP